VKQLVGLGVMTVFAASGCGAADSPQAEAQRMRTGPGIERRTIDASVSVRPGASGVIYIARGRHGPIGRFLGVCRSGGTPRTAYEPTPQAATAIAAVDGRGVSRAATVVPRQRLSGGNRRSGLERWLIRMGRKSEDVTLEASMQVVRQRGGPDCTFWLYGSMTLLRR
jgi:hypothetical protein